ncbi:hypothetical protein GY45DRAFT_704142 [Cubamyces sp. BRFM 1775]|nr:hypothetical protein GY45DRAFT_704142 [Cubamyces sp. BRFM 1775]
MIDLKAEPGPAPKTASLPPPPYAESIQNASGGQRSGNLPQGHAPNDASLRGLQQPLAPGQSFASASGPTREGEAYPLHSQQKAFAQYAAPPGPPHQVPPFPPGAAPPIPSPPGASSAPQATVLSVGAQYQEQLLAKCAVGDHDMVTKHGAGGIIAAVCLFPIGLLCLL